jgi:hypothetical protein
MKNLEMNISNQQLPVITFNFEEIKSTLTQSMEQYKNLIVTEETLSICKSDQKELAGVRIKIDGYRKDVKKEMSKPIDEFEDKCKQLIKVVEEAEKPLKEAIAVFDDKKKAEKRLVAEECIKETIAKHGLKDEFAAELTVQDSYCNLTATYKTVAEDIEQRAFIAIGKQQAHEELLEMLQGTIDNVNQGINTKLSLNEFDYLIRNRMPGKEIINEINKRAEKIKLAELPKEEVKVEVVAPTPIKVEAKESEPMYFVELRIEDTKGNIEALAKFMKENGYAYTTINKGRL